MATPPVNMRKLCLLIALFTVLLPTIAFAEWFQEQRVIMGTQINVELWLDDQDRAMLCAEKVFDEMRRIDALMSPFKENSQLSQVNHQAARHPVEISKELFMLIEQAQEISKLSEGVFDITFASVGRFYDYRKNVRPTDEEIKSKLDAVNYRHIQLDHDQLTITFTHPGVSIDLGGIAKGYAVDNGIQLLIECGVKNGLVSAGGDSRILGKRGDRPWMMGIQHPRKRSELVVALPLSDTAISTSGDYERFFIEDGKRYHHIITPGSGKSATGTISATVIGEDAVLTDALSTTVFIMGAARGIKLIETLPDIDAIIIDTRGKMHFSSGLQEPDIKSSK